MILLSDRQYTAPSAADPVAMTASGTSWGNSAYVTVLDPTPAACVLTGVIFSTTDGEGSPVTYDFEVDIATGGAGAEVVIATVRGCNDRGFSSQAGPTLCWVLPIPIDSIGAGVRVSARFRKAGTSTAGARHVAITYLRKPLVSTTVLTTAAPQKTIPPAATGVTVTAGGSAYVSGSWAELRAATGAALVITGIVFGAPSHDAVYELDLGTGASGSETVITTFRVRMTHLVLPAMMMLPNPLDHVAASTRLAARLRSSTSSAWMVASLMVLEKPL